MAELGEELWRPDAAFRDAAKLTAFMEWLAENRGKRFADYHALWRWSVDDLEGFWQSVWDYFGLHSSTPYTRPLAEERMPGARWFDGARVSYPARLLEPGRDEDVAIHHFSECREPGRLTRGELRAQVRSVAIGLRKAGVKSGDRVAAYMPNTPEATIAMLATTAIGGVWSSCSPDFGVNSVLDRFRQIEPKVLFAVDGYRYGGKSFERKEAVRALLDGLPSVEQVVYLPYLDPGDPGRPFPSAQTWEEIASTPCASDDDPLAADHLFDHPLWVVYSSGTTGLPKGIVHGHGGVLLEQLKLHGLHTNLGPESCMFFYTTTGWVMFNLLVNAMATGASIVLYDGSPAYPDLYSLWRMAEQTDTTNFGTSPTFINILAQNGVRPRDRIDVSKLRGIICSGSPLTPESFEWFYANVRSDLWVSSISGGTDVVTGFVGAAATLPVHAGEIQAPSLGVDVHAFDANGNSVIEEEGELVVTRPMPSMPLNFWNDPDGRRYHESYFDVYPGVWRHGDLLRITSRGSCVISGRSDSTLNRFGIRIGTSEVYRTVEAMDEIVDSLVVHLTPNQHDSLMVLFVVLREGGRLDEPLIERICATLRTERSPRHVPDRVIAIDAVPYTLTGKKMEVPVKRILSGQAVEEVANRDAMADPQALETFTRLAASMLKAEF